MTTWFTSDLHFGHERIIEFCSRPFSNVTEMNMELVHRWNSIVEDSDTVYVLGDLALGKLNDSLQYASMLRGGKYLVPGNHDRMWSGLPKIQLEKVRWYEDAGFTILPEQYLYRWGQPVHLLLCHFPYVGDSQELDRHVSHRPVDRGDWLLHGHTHWATAIGPAHPRQIHVGVDAWGYAPVALETIKGIIETSTWIDETLGSG